ncbi:MAG: hypothetical protein ABIO71_08205 [Caldimonas sp.]
MDDDSRAQVLEDARRLRAQARRTRDRLGDVVHAHLQARALTLQLFGQVAEVLRCNEQGPVAERAPERRRTVRVADRG